jgi:DNA polymerase
MKDDSHHPSVSDKVYRFFEYLSCFESELYLTRPHAAFSSPLLEQPEKQAVSQTKETGLNPYPAYAPYTSLEQMESAVRGCLRCPLGSSRSKFVFGTGSSHARVVFIGEAPGAEEDRQGIPFVGRAGKLLDHMLEQIGWSREEVYICNILKCRPPRNRDPQPDEVAMCEPYLHEQLRLLDAEWLVALGRVAAQVLLRTSAPLRALRGRVHRYRDKPFWVTYHPAALLRNQNLMPDAHQDLITLKQMVLSGNPNLDDQL